MHLIWRLVETNSSFKQFFISENHGYSRHNSDCHNDWTYLGNTTWIVGDITDAVHGTAVLGNDTIVFATLFAGEGVFDLSTGLLNNTTGSYNISIRAPTVVPSGVYGVEVLPISNLLLHQVGLPVDR